MLKGGEINLYHGVMYRIDFSWRNHSSSFDKLLSKRTFRSNDDSWTPVGMLWLQKTNVSESQRELLER